jgi:hypothetical protein
MFALSLVQQSKIPYFFLVLFYSTSFNFPMDVIGDIKVFLVSFNFKY